MSFARLREEEEEGGGGGEGRAGGRESDSTTVVEVEMSHVEGEDQTGIELQHIEEESRESRSTEVDEESGGELMELDSSAKGRLRRHFQDNIACYVPISVAILCALVIVGFALLFGGPEIDFSPSKPCVECFQGEPDEFGFVPMAFYPFSEKQAVRRNERFQYNGNPGAKIYEAAVSLDTVFRAIFGDITARKESLIYRWIRYAVTNQSIEIYQTSGLREYFNITTKLIGIARDFIYEQGFVGDDGRVSRYHGMMATEYAMNFFWRNLSRSEIEKYNLEYNTTQNGFDNHGGFSVWTTIYQELAPTYGSLIAVFKPEVSMKGLFDRHDPPRTIDLNMWNYEKNGIFVYPNNTEWEDTGEFTAPGWRSSKDFYGMLLHKQHSLPTSFRKAAMNYSTVLFGFFKLEYNQKTYILVLDGHLSNGSLSECIEQGDDGWFYHCEYQKPFPMGNMFPSYPTLLRDERCRVIGLISACTYSEGEGEEGDSTCELPPPSLMKQYKSVISPYTIPKQVVDYISETRWTNPLDETQETRLYFHPINSTAVVNIEPGWLPLLDRKI